jgi:riboflavin kinase / FMN adenylyltransferase
MSIDAAEGRPGTTLTGVVVAGDQRGRTLGFPTANLRLPTDGPTPPFGVYAAFLDGMPAAVSIGVRPTFGQGLEPLLEAHVLDFSGDLYGRVVTVRLLDRVRDELKLDSAGELVLQMGKDIERVREIVATATGLARTIG